MGQVSCSAQSSPGKCLNSEQFAGVFQKPLKMFTGKHNLRKVMNELNCYVINCYVCNVSMSLKSMSISNISKSISNIEIRQSLKAELFAWVVQSPINLNQD